MFMFNIIHVQDHYLKRGWTWSNENIMVEFILCHILQTFPTHPILFDRQLESLLVPIFLYFYTLNLKPFPFTKFFCFKNFQWPRCIDFYCDLWHFSISSINYFDLWHGVTRSSSCNGSAQCYMTMINILFQRPTP
jgi:hypothetical protein